jgi:uncharacterized integral membrane protein
MVALGLLLLLASGALTVGVVVANTDGTTLAAFGQATSALNLGGVFLAGAITGAIAILGVTMVLAGASRGRARRAELRRRALDERQEKESLAEENARLRGELEGARPSSYADEAVYPEDRPVGRHADTENTTENGRGLFHR